MLCIGIGMRLMLVLIDAAYRLFVNPGGLVESEFIKTHEYFISDSFVYNADICFYFSFFAIGCDWIEVFFTFKMVQTLDEAKYYKIRRRFQTFFLSVIFTFMVIYICFFILRLFPVKSNALYETILDVLFIISAGI